MLDDGVNAQHPDTKRAVEAVGESAPTDYILRPEDHAAALPDGAGALKRVLDTEELKNLAKLYRESDAAAGDSQRLYKLLGNIRLRATFYAVAVGAAFILLSSTLVGLEPATLNPITDGSIILEALLLGTALVATRLLRRTDAFEKWMNHRATAEKARVEYFAAMVTKPGAVQPGEIPLLPLKLEYFRRYLLENRKRLASPALRLRSRERSLRSDSGR